MKLFETNISAFFLNLLTLRAESPSIFLDKSGDSARRVESSSHEKYLIYNQKDQKSLNWNTRKL